MKPANQLPKIMVLPYVFANKDFRLFLLYFSCVCVCMCFPFLERRNALKWCCCLMIFWCFEMMHPRKLTAGYPKWWALEKVTPASNSAIFGIWLFNFWGVSCCFLCWRVSNIRFLGGAKQSPLKETQKLVVVSPIHLKNTQKSNWIMKPWKF